MVDQTADRVQGVDFAQLADALEDLSYPVTVDEVVERHGDTEIGRTNADSIQVGTLFADLQGTTFDSAKGVRQMVLSQMPRNSEGRMNYSDRGGSLPVETDAAAAATEQTTADLQGGEDVATE